MFSFFWFNRSDSIEVSCLHDTKRKNPIWNLKYHRLREEVYLKVYLKIYLKSSYVLQIEYKSLVLCSIQTRDSNEILKSYQRTTETFEVMINISSEFDILVHVQCVLAVMIPNRHDRKTYICFANGKSFKLWIESYQSELISMSLIKFDCKCKLKIYMQMKANGNN